MSLLFFAKEKREEARALDVQVRGSVCVGSLLEA